MRSAGGGGGREEVPKHLLIEHSCTSLNINWQLISSPAPPAALENPRQKIYISKAESRRSPRTVSQGGGLSRLCLFFPPFLVFSLYLSLFPQPSVVHPETGARERERERCRDKEEEGGRATPPCEVGTRGRLTAACVLGFSHAH